MAADLDTSFSRFFVELHRRDPYRWQVRAARELADGEPWDVLTAPTGAGKTTLIECFLFALATRGPGMFPRRLFWVVDRRAVVDQVYEHAAAIAEKLASPTGEAIREVARGLRDVADRAMRPSDPPVEVRLWRGGLVDDPDLAGPGEALSPAVPAIVCSTVDQVGSRLLFRGYGVRPRSRAAEAALVGMDSLLVLDEAHLSKPFLDTARAVVAAQGNAASPARPMHVLSVSATPPESSAGRVFELRPDELEEERLARRLRTHKRVTLATGRGQKAQMVREARRLGEQGARLVGIVANTVAVARRVARELGDDALLVIGPSRPLDRKDLLSHPALKADRAERPDTTVFLVGTQTIEVGLDLDLDALVTACAPFPSLVQRFGRLDRAGELKETNGVIVAPPARCPVYGEETSATWEWLRKQAENGELDFGSEGIAKLRESDPPPPPPPPRAPLLGPWHLDALVQTTVEPHASPDVAVFLHGERGLEAADVQLVWRADVREDDPPEVAAARVQLRPPHPDEVLSLPVRAVRRWLQRSAVPDFADIESTSDEGVWEGTGRPPRKALRVQPPNASEPSAWIEGGEVRPGDLLVVPAAYGGCDRFGWAPDSNAEVADYGDLNRRRPAVLLPIPQPGEKRRDEWTELERLTEDVAMRLAADELGEQEAYEELAEGAQAWLLAADDDVSDSVNDARNAVAARLWTPDGWAGRAIPSPSIEAPEGLILVAGADWKEAPVGKPVAYEDHVEPVVRRTTAHAAALRLDVGLRETLRLAAEYHDVGKLDPRFQAWLNDGVPPLHELAKSGRPLNDPVVRRARVAAGWPRGLRHEDISVALLRKVERWADGIDRDLLLHLVAVHHGYGRPFRSAAEDPAPTIVEVEIERQKVAVSSGDREPWADHAERFVRLNERFGPWGLALLECTLIAADWAASAEAEAADSAGKEQELEGVAR